MSSTRPTSILQKFINVAIVVALLCTAAFIVIPTVGGPRPGTPRGLDGSNLRTIGNARITYDSDHPDGMPPNALTDVYAFAAELARSGVMPDPSLWFSGMEPAAKSASSDMTSVMDPTTKRIDLRFKNAPLAFAVALLPTAMTLPPTTPIAWTRGLQSDGTWRKDSPYGGEGGFVFFVGGDMHFFKTTTDPFVQWGTQELTRNILEALPPGTRIGEYVPSLEDLRRAQINRWIPWLVGLVFTALLILIWRTKRASKSPPTAAS